MGCTLHLKFGFISDIDPANGLVKVAFPDETDEGGTADGGTDKPLVSDWLPISTRKSLKDKETFPFDVDEHVWCIMDEYLEYGICCGALFNETDLPDGAGEDIYRLLYKDGSYEQFDRSNGNKTVFYKGTYLMKTDAGAEIEMTDKVKFKTGSESLHDLLKDMLTYITQATFTNGAGVTGFTNNIADFNNLLTRLENLLA